MQGSNETLFLHALQRSLHGHSLRRLTRRRAFAADPGRQAPPNSGATATPPRPAAGMIVCIIGVCSFEDRSTLRAAARAVLCIAPVPLSILPGPTTKYQLPNLTRPYNVLARWPATGAAPAALRCNLGVSEIKPFRATLPVPRRPCCRHQVQLNHASAREPVAGSSGRLVVWSVWVWIWH